MKGINGLLKLLMKSLGADNNQNQQTGEPPQKQVPQMQEQNNIVVKHHRVAGVSHYKDNILTLARENPDYNLKKNELIKRQLFDEYIDQYKFFPEKVELMPEPTNQYDPNAVQVLVDGKLVGYIKAGSCKHILNIINENRIEKIEAKIKGGKYKCLLCHGDVPEEDCEMERGTAEFRIELSIYERNKEK